MNNSWVWIPLRGVKPWSVDLEVEKARTLTMPAVDRFALNSTLTAYAFADGAIDGPSGAVMGALQNEADGGLTIALARKDSKAINSGTYRGALFQLSQTGAGLGVKSARFADRPLEAYELARLDKSVTDGAEHFAKQERRKTEALTNAGRALAGCGKRIAFGVARR
jgi:hypothetical protein